MVLLLSFDLFRLEHIQMKQLCVSAEQSWERLA